MESLSDDSKVSTKGALVALEWQHITEPFIDLLDLRVCTHTFGHVLLEKHRVCFQPWKQLL